MPLTLNVGISKKRGLPDYGSVGAICDVTFELDASLLTQDLDGFQRQVHHAYVACAQAVNDELARHKPNRPARGNGRGGSSHRPSRGEGSSGQGNGHGAAVDSKDNANGNANGGGQRASESQYRYVSRLARGIDGLCGQGLETLVGRMFGKPLADLSSLDASRLIDELRAHREGRLSLVAVLDNPADA
jgi:hypothetical protein